MIHGKITANREAVIELEVAGPTWQPRRIQAVIDTGYNGVLTLPGQTINTLQLPFVGYRQGTLADGRVVFLEVFLATVDWHGRKQEVVVSRAEGAPLLGMSLLHGSRMTMDVIDGGPVKVEELP